MGESYRQEYALNNAAEDMVEVLDLEAQEIVPFANGGSVLKTRDFTPIEPGAVEFKFYVPGIGFVLEVRSGDGREPRVGRLLTVLTVSH